MKECKVCNIEKSLENFRITGNYKGKEYRLSTCNTCYNKQRNEYNRKYRQENKDKVNANKRRYYKERMDNSILRDSINEQQRNRYSKYVHKRLLRNAKKRAEKKEIEFNLELEDIVIPELCPILEIPLFTGTKGNYDNSPSLDRVDNSLGYVKGNVRVISNLANTMKNSANVDQLKIFTKNILNYLNEDIVQTAGNDNL